MSDTQDIIAWLRAGNAAPYVEAADRLAELDAESYATLGIVAEMRTINALRPPCPTCDGKGPNRKDSTYHDEVFPSPCTDCVDGRMPFERAMRWVEFILAWNEQPNSQGRTPYEEGRASLITDVRRIQ